MDVEEKARDGEGDEKPRSKKEPQSRRGLSPEHGDGQGAQSAAREEQHRNGEEAKPGAPPHPTRDEHRRRTTDVGAGTIGRCRP